MELDPQLIAQNELQKGESLRWTGQPDPRRVAMKSIPIGLFSIPVLAFMAHWMWGAAGHQLPDLTRLNWGSLFPLFGLIGVFAGLRLLFTPLIEYRRAARTVYAVTNRRALIIVQGRSAKVHSFASAELVRIERKARPDGSGDLLFGRSDPNGGYRESSGSAEVVTQGFIGIADIKQVEQYLLEAARS